MARYVLIGLLLLIGPAQARDPGGRYAAANPQLHAWFDKLASGKGLCCSFADGLSISDVDWDMKDGHYRVYFSGATVNGVQVPDGWVDVPDDAVVTEPNRFGPAVVWPYLTYDGERSSVLIRCFMPGAGT